MNVKLFTPYNAQKEFIDKFVDTDDLFGCVVAPRGSGKTLLAINVSLYWLLQNDNQKLGWVSPTFSQAKSVLDEIVKAAPDLVVSSNRMEATITFVNGSTIKFLSADSADNIRGFRFTHLILDEFAYIKEDVVNTVILPTLNPNGVKCLMISTPAGKNHLFTWYNKDDVVSHRITLEECPYISQDLLVEAKKSLPSDIYAQEYLAEFKDATNDVFIGIERVSIVEQYTTGGDAYVGIDTGLTDDMSVLCILSPIGRVLNIVGINNEPIHTIADKFSQTLSQYNIIGGYIEVNGIGRAMYDLLHKQYRKIKPFTTNQENKSEMVRKLISDIETNTVELPTQQLCPILHTEFSAYTYKINQTGKLSFGHRNGYHDDYIDALMLANISRNQFVNRRPMSVGGSRKRSISVDWGIPK